MPYTGIHSWNQTCMSDRDNTIRMRERCAPGVITDMLIRLRSHTCQSRSAARTRPAAKCSSSPTDELSYSWRRPQMSSHWRGARAQARPVGAGGGRKRDNGEDKVRVLSVAGGKEAHFCDG